MTPILCKMKILVASDPRTRETFRWILAAAGCRPPFEAEEGVAASRILASGAADLAFIDDDLSVLNAIEAIRLAGGADGAKVTPAVVLSAHPEKWHIEQSSAAGACGYLQKPPAARGVLEFMAKRAAEIPAISSDPADKPPAAVNARRGARTAGAWGAGEA